MHCKGLNTPLLPHDSMLLECASLSLCVSDNLLDVMQLSLCLIKKPAKVIYAMKAHAVVVTTVMLGGVVLLLYKVISGADIVLQVTNVASRQAFGKLGQACLNAQYMHHKHKLTCCCNLLAHVSACTCHLKLPWPPLYIYIKLCVIPSQMQRM